jgi:type II secretory pathway component PulM
MTLREQIDNLRRRVALAIAPLLEQSRARIAPLIAQTRARYEKLEPRERTLVQIAGGLLAAFIAWSFIVAPIAGLIGGLDGRIADREHDLANVRRMVESYSRVKSELSQAEHNTVPESRDFSLFSVVEASFTRSVGRDKIASITPAADRALSGGLVQYSVQLKLSAVNLTQVVDALYSVQNLAVPVGISNLRIQRRTQDPHSFDVDITCFALGHSA